MSFETLIFLLIFVLLPLFEWLGGMLRQRREQQARRDRSAPTMDEGIQRPAPPAPRAESRRPGAQPAPPDIVQPQTTRRPGSGMRPTREAVQTATAPQRTPEVQPRRVPDRQRPKVRPAVAAGSRVTARALTSRLRDPVSLREAVVLSTILGPCRADEPYGGA